MSPIFCSHTVSTIQPDQIMRRGSACREISQCNRSISWVRGSIEKYKTQGYHKVIFQVNVNMDGGQ